MNKAKILIRTENVTKSFINTEGKTLLVLESVNFQIREREITAILGKSGSGKSTLLRIISGLIKPSQGNIYFKEKLVTEPVKGIAMVFQSFAIMPWLTVLENVELGLEAQGVAKRIRRKMALRAIDTIGLDGFESAYPKELSGGMRQRVGFARALVVEPELLLMDEPFSALDILTAENLRNDLLDLWHDKQTKIKGILFVTHDIEEAVLMANRIIIFDNDPGRINTELKVDLPYPRDPESVEFKQLLDQIYITMTTSERDKIAKAKEMKKRVPSGNHPEYSYRVPEVDISELTGLLESMLSHEVDGKIDLPNLAEDLHLDINNLFPLTEVLDLLRFAKISEGELSFTEAGRNFASADILKRKKLFAEHLLKYIPLAKHIRQVLDTTNGHRINEDYFIDELENYFSAGEAERIFKTIIDLGRYAEIFAYDYDAGELSLENPQ